MQVTSPLLLSTTIIIINNIGNATAVDTTAVDADNEDFTDDDVVAIDAGQVTLPPVVDYTPDEEGDHQVDEEEEPGEAVKVRVTRSGRTAKRRIDPDFIEEYKRARQKHHRIG